jgi:surface protein
MNYSGIEYNIITSTSNGPTNNYLRNASLLKTFYTTINSLNRWIVPSYYIALPLEDMIINIVTTAPNTTMVLPFGGIASINVNWGNGTLLNYINTPSTIYSSPGSYSIRISGYATSYGITTGTYTGANLISSVTQWGTLGLVSLAGAFNGASTLVSVPSSISEYVTNLSFMFSNASSFNQDLSTWNTSNVTTMSNMFINAINFNENIRIWNTSNVSSVNNMFRGASSFNQDISRWSTSKITNMTGMFLNASSFNQNISSWNVSNVILMGDMFANALNFNQNISPWITSNVTNMFRMFQDASKFKQNLSLWSVSNVVNAANIFCRCPGMLEDPTFRPNIVYPGYISSCF